MLYSFSLARHMPWLSSFIVDGIDNWRCNTLVMPGCNGFAPPNEETLRLWDPPWNSAKSSFSFSKFVPFQVLKNEKYGLPDVRIGVLIKNACHKSYIEINARYFSCFTFISHLAGMILSSKQGFCIHRSTLCNHWSSSSPPWQSLKACLSNWMCIEVWRQDRDICALALLKGKFVAVNRCFIVVLHGSIRFWDPGSWKSLLLFDN